MRRANDARLSEFARQADAWQREMWRQCGIAIACWIDQSNLENHQCRQLKIHQFEGMAVAAIGTYNDIREAKRKELCLRGDVFLELPNALDELLNVVKP